MPKRSAVRAASNRHQRERTDDTDLDSGLIPVNRLEDIPQFKTEDEEAEFWSTHSFGEALLERMERIPPEGNDEFPPARAETIPPVTRDGSVVMRLDDRTFERVLALARKRRVGYRKLLKQFILDGLEEEERRETRAAS